MKVRNQLVPDLLFCDVVFLDRFYCFFFLLGSPVEFFLGLEEGARHQQVQAYCEEHEHDAESGREQALLSGGEQDRQDASEECA